MGTVSNINVFKNDPSPTVGEGLSTLRDNQTAFREMVGALPPVTVTALGDNYSLPVNSASIILDVPNNSQVRLISIRGNLSGEVSTEDSEFHNGMVIKLWGVSGKTVTLKHKGNNAIASYNIQSIDNSDIVLSHTIPTVLTYDSDNNIWIERERVATILSDTTGDLTNLTTTNKTNLVAAINEVKGNTSTNATNISNLSSKVGTGTISNKVTNTNVVVALNDLVTKIGLPLSSLTTSVKTSLITAINSLVSDTVHKTGDETIAGTKTFTGNVTVNQAKYRLAVKDTNSDTVRGNSIIEGVSSDSSTGIHTMFGSYGTTILGGGEGKDSLLAELAGEQAESVQIISDSYVKFYVNANTYADKKEISFLANGNLVGVGGVYRNTTNSSLTLANGTSAAGGGGIWLYGKDASNHAGSVRLQTYDDTNGYKQFDINADGTATWGGRLLITNTASDASTSSLDIYGTANHAISIRHSGVTKGTAPSAGRYSAVEFLDKDGDVNNKRIGILENSLNTSNDCTTAIRAYNCTSNNQSNYASLSVTYKADGTTFASAPSTPATGNNTDVITRDFSDTKFVHTTGNEEISGSKTYKDDVVISEEISRLTMQMTNLDTTQTSTTNKIHSAIAFNDKNGLDQKYRTAIIQSGITAGDNNFMYLLAYNPTVNSTASNGIKIYCNRDGNYKVTAPSTLTDSELASSNFIYNDNDIITRDFIPKDTRIVHTTGNETIADNKTFTSPLRVSNAGTYMYVSNPNLTKGTPPSTQTNFYFPIGDKTIAGGTAHYFGANELIVRTSGEIVNRIYAYKNEAGSTTDAQFNLIYPATGSPYATCPETPTDRSGSTDIVTRGYLSNYVSKSTWETSKIVDIELAALTTATSSTPYSLTTTNFGTGYKEFFIKLFHSTAQSKAANIRYKITFSGNKTITGQVNNGISTSANNYGVIRVINDNGFLFTQSCQSAGNPGRAAWYVLNGSSGTYVPNFADYDATITQIDFWSITTDVTALPVGLKILIWGRK